MQPSDDARPGDETPHGLDASAWAEAPRFFLSKEELWQGPRDAQAGSASPGGGPDRPPEEGVTKESRALRERVVVRGDEAHHAVRVLRVAVGDPVVLLDGSGDEMCGVVEHVASDRREAEVVVGRLVRRRSQAEPAFAVHHVQGLPKGDKLELVLQKGTELGVTHFWPVYSERVVVSYPPQKVAARHARWVRIVLEAAKQSRRARLPEVAAPIGLEEAVRSLRARGCTVVVLWERAREPLRVVLNRHRAISSPSVRWSGQSGDLDVDRTTGPGSDRGTTTSTGIALVVGPEGGLSAKEVERLVQMGAETASLGPRILRTETAGMLAGALALYELESHEAPIDGAVPGPPEEGQT